VRPLSPGYAGAEAQGFTPVPGTRALIECLAVPLGKTLHPHQRALAAQDREDGHQQHPPLREANAPAHPAIGQRLEKADQIACSSRRGGGLGGQGADAVPAQNTVVAATQPGLLGQTSNRPWVVRLPSLRLGAAVELQVHRNVLPVGRVLRGRWQPSLLNPCRTG
jgi:hypothetical protein